MLIDICQSPDLLCSGPAVWELYNPWTSGSSNSPWPRYWGTQCRQNNKNCSDDLPALYYQMAHSVGCRLSLWVITSQIFCIGITTHWKHSLGDRTLWGVARFEWLHALGGCMLWVEQLKVIKLNSPPFATAVQHRNWKIFSQNSYRDFVIRL